MTSTMTALSLTSSLKDDILVVGLAQGPAQRKGGKPSLIIESGDLALDAKSLEEILGDMGATGKADEVIKIPGNSVRLLVFTGLGKASSSYGHELLRRAAGAASRTLSNQKSATFALPAQSLEAVSAVAQGAALGAYLFNEFRSDEVVTNNSSLASAKIFTPHAAKSEFKDLVLEASDIAQYTFLTRDLINTPPSHLNPASFADRMTAVVKAAGGARAAAPDRAAYARLPAVSALLHPDEVRGIARDGHEIGIDADDGPVFRRDVIDMIGGEHGAGARHIAHDHLGLAWHVFTHMARQHPRGEIVAAARRVADDDIDRFVLVEICDRLRAERRGTDKGRNKRGPHGEHDRLNMAKHGRLPVGGRRPNRS